MLKDELRMEQDKYEAVAKQVCSDQAARSVAAWLTASIIPPAGVLHMRACSLQTL